MDNKRTILVIDDDDMIRELLALVIADNFPKWEVAVIQACDGVEGLELAKSLHPAIIITDVKMPGLDGMELVRQLRADLSTRSISIITISGTADPAMAIAAGSDQFVHKPFELEEMIDAIGRWLSPLEGAVPATRTQERDRFAMINERTAANRARIAEIRELLEKRATEATARWELIVIAKEHTLSRLALAKRRRKLAEDRLIQAQVRREQSQDGPPVSPTRNLP